MTYAEPGAVAALRAHERTMRDHHAGTALADALTVALEKVDPGLSPTELVDRAESLQDFTWATVPRYAGVDLPAPTPDTIAAALEVLRYRATHPQPADPFAGLV